MNSSRILLVEDNPPDARYVKELLLSEVKEIIVATSLLEARDTVKANRADLILLDLSLPDAHGLETLLAMAETDSSIPIIVLTGLDDEQISLEAVQSGAQDYILKQELNEYSLVRAIRYAIERKRAEQSMKRLAALEQREEFMATLTHDLKTPLIGANRILELIAASEFGTLAPDQANLLLQLRDGNKMLLSMIQNLIEAYRFEKDVYEVALEKTDLIALANHCVQDILPIALNRQVELKTNLGEEIPELNADQTGIRRVIQNLLENAVKFTPSGGCVTIDIRHDGDAVELSVSDTGPGISAADQDRLFQRFMRVGSKYTPGTGLGLYLCKQIVDAHCGQIRCISEEGRGSKFIVFLPLASSAVN